MRDIITKLTTLLTRREKVQLGFLLLATLVSALLEMVGVGAIPAFVASLTNPSGLRSQPIARWIFDAVGVTTDMEVVRFIALALVSVVVVKAIYLALLTWVTARYVFRRQVVLSRRLFTAYLTSPYTFHLQRNSAELLRNTNQDAILIVGSALVPLLTVALEGMTLLMILALLLVVEPVTSVAAALILGGTTAVFIRVVRRRLNRLGEEQRTHRADMIRSVTEGLGGIKTTKILGREAHFLTRFTDASEGFATAGVVKQVVDVLPRLILETVAVVGLLGVAGALLAAGRTVESLVPTLTLLAVAVVRMIPSFGRITASQTAMQWGKAALDGVYDDLVTLEANPVSNPDPHPSLQHGIRLDHVTYTYPEASRPSLIDVSIEVGRGQAVGLVGPTGSGKTTAVDVILGLLAPTEGQVTVDGADIAGRERGWQRHVGYIPQDIYLSDTTIRENIAFGIPAVEIDDDAVWRAVDAAQVREFVERLPEQLETMVGERGVRLSGGQRQRIGIARSLYHDPDVLVMDEATSALDNETEKYVMEAIEHLKGSRTLILIAHRLSTVEACDRLYLLRDGRIEAAGTFDELQGHSESFQRLAARN